MVVEDRYKPQKLGEYFLGISSFPFLGLSIELELV
jgi:hypothetical protein